MKYALALLCATFCGASPLLAAPAAPSTPIVSWADEAALSAPVSLESPRLTASELASAVAAQTGVKLSLPPELAGRVLVIRARAMPLRELLPALAQLYGLEWTREAAPGSYGARVAATPLELAVLQLGDLNELRERGRSSAQEGEREAAAVLTKNWSEAQLKEGVAFSSLPAATGLALRAAKGSRSALNALGEWGQWSPFVLRSLRVRVVPGRAPASSAPQLVLIDPTGQTLRNLGALEPPKS